MLCVKVCYEEIFRTISPQYAVNLSTVMDWGNGLYFQETTRSYQASHQGLEPSIDLAILEA